MGDSCLQSPCLHCQDPPSNIPIPPKRDDSGNSQCYSRKKNCCRKQCYCNYYDCRDKPAQCKRCSDFGCSTPNCMGCDTHGSKVAFREIQQKKIWNQVRVSSSLYMMNLDALNVFNSRSKVRREGWYLDSTGHYVFKDAVLPWNQMSDRLKPSCQVVVTPSHGNSRRGTKTAHRPGAGSPGGCGVDVKHGSYDRYLARKKGHTLRTSVIAKEPKHGNKRQAYNIIDNKCCPKPPQPPCPPPPCPPPCPPPGPPKPPCPPCMQCVKWPNKKCGCPSCLPFNPATYPLYK